MRDRRGVGGTTLEALGHPSGRIYPKELCVGQHPNFVYVWKEHLGAARRVGWGRTANEDDEFK